MLAKERDGDSPRNPTISNPPVTNAIPSCPLFIGIAGGTATGKSTLANIVAENCPGANVVSLDEFYRALNPGEAGETHDWDDISSYDWEEFIRCLDGWSTGIGQWVPEHNFKKYERYDHAKFIEASPVMIFEGIHMLGHPEVRRRLDLMIYVKCDADTALSRRIRRDINDRGYDLELIIARYHQYVKPAFIKQIEPTEKYATISIPNDVTMPLRDHKCIEVILAFIKVKLGLKNINM
jgi:uridine kinase